MHIMSHEKNRKTERKGIPMTPEQLIEIFLKNHDVNDNTRKVYRYALAYFYRWLVKTGRQADQPTRADILAYKAELKETLMPSTIGLYISAVKAFFRFLSDAGYYDNIGHGIKTVRKMHSYARDPLPIEDVRKLLQSIHREKIADYRDFATISILYYNALRIIEVARLRHRDIDLANKQMYIIGKGRDNFDIVPINENVCTAIEDYIQQKIDAGLHIDENYYLMQSHAYKSKDNQPVGPLTMSIIVGRRLKEAGLKTRRITGHSLRHSAAVHMINGGKFDLYAVQLFLRHKDPNKTRLYTHHAERMKMSQRKPTMFLQTYFNQHQIPS